MPTQDTGSFSVTLTDTSKQKQTNKKVNNKKGLNANRREVWDPPTVEMPLPATQNFKVMGESTWVDSLRNKFCFIWKEKAVGIKWWSHNSPPSLLSLPPWTVKTGTITGKEVKGIPRQGEGQPTATAYSTYSDVGPDVGGGDYGAPSRPVRCESLNQWQTGYPGHVQPPPSPLLCHCLPPWAPELRDR